MTKLVDSLKSMSIQSSSAARGSNSQHEIRQGLRGNLDAYKEVAWNKADKVPGRNPDLYRQDKCENIIYWHSYDKDSDMGWNIDHSKPVRAGGTNHGNNLQALQTSQNKSKNATYPYQYESVEPRGVTRQDMIQTDLDKRCAGMRNGDVILNYDGSVSAISRAVKRGDVILNKDGSISKNSKAVKSGDVFFLRA